MNHFEVKFEVLCSFYQYIYKIPKTRKNQLFCWFFDKFEYFYNTIILEKLLGWKNYRKLALLGLFRYILKGISTIKKLRFFLFFRNFFSVVMLRRCDANFFLIYMKNAIFRYFFMIFFEITKVINKCFLVFFQLCFKYLCEISWIYSKKHCFFAFRGVLPPLFVDKKGGKSPRKAFFKFQKSKSQRQWRFLKTQDFDDLKTLKGQIIGLCLNMREGSFFIHIERLTPFFLPLFTGWILFSPR